MDRRFKRQSGPKVTILSWNLAAGSALRKLERDQKPNSPFVFTSERGGPFTRFAINRLIERLRAATKMEIKAHPLCLS